MDCMQLSLSLSSSSSSSSWFACPLRNRLRKDSYQDKNNVVKGPVYRKGKAAISCCSTGEQEDAAHQLLARRHVLSLAASTSTGLLMWSGPASWAAPVQPPDLKQCTTPIDPGNGAAKLDCCLPVSATISAYKVPAGVPVRIRRPAHKASPEYIAKYNKAYQLLKALPASDPRNFTQQVNVHCAFCDSAYDEKGTKTEYQVHNSWLFLPWHRWYLYFHERILGSVLKDPTFALPFWNWDAATGNTMPPMYMDAKSQLYDANRNPAHKPPKVVDLNYNLVESNASAAAQQKANDSAMYRHLVSGAKTPALFFGEAYRQGGAPGPGPGSLENLPHGTVHTWTGNPANPNDENMGALYSASRDPLFYAHHANLDRLWDTWKSQGGRRRDLSDPDWLDATFLFYDENAKLVRVAVRDALDTTKLGYRYEDVPNAWLKAKPASSVKAKVNAKASAAAATAAVVPGFKEEHPALLPVAATGPVLKGEGVAMAAPSAAGLGNVQEIKEFKDLVSKSLDSGPITVLVKRPKKVKAADFEEEILVLEGVQVPTDEKVKFDLYINLPTKLITTQATDTDNPDVIGGDVSEYAGSFYNVPHLGMKAGDQHGRRLRKCNFRLGIGEVLQELDAEQDDSFTLTIIPRSRNTVPISIDQINLQYE